MNSTCVNPGQPERSWLQALPDVICCSAWMLSGLLGWAYLAWLVWTMPL